MDDPPPPYSNTAATDIDPPPYSPMPISRIQLPPGIRRPVAACRRRYLTIHKDHNPHYSGPGCFEIRDAHSCPVFWCTTKTDPHHYLSIKQNDTGVPLVGFVHLNSFSHGLRVGVDIEGIPRGRPTPMEHIHCMDRKNDVYRFRDHTHVFRGAADHYRWERVVTSTIDGREREKFHLVEEPYDCVLAIYEGWVDERCDDDQIARLDFQESVFEQYFSWEGTQLFALTSLLGIQLRLREVRSREERKKNWWSSLSTTTTGSRSDEARQVTATTTTAAAATAVSTTNNLSGSNNRSTGANVRYTGEHPLSCRRRR